MSYWEGIIVQLMNTLDWLVLATHQCLLWSYLVKIIEQTWWAERTNRAPKGNGNYRWDMLDSTDMHIMDTYAQNMNNHLPWVLAYNLNRESVCTVVVSVDIHLG